MRLYNYDLGLFEQVVSEHMLHEAFLEVKKNRGAPGIDQVSISRFEENLHENLSTLSKELKEWRYKPKPVKRVEIPKPNGGIRLLGIPCVRDRVVQASIKAVLEPIYEKEFSPSSFGFRPGRSQKQAIAAAKSHALAGKDWVVDIDLSKFFDTVNHDRLIHRMKTDVKDNRILRLIGLILRSGVLNKDGSFEKTTVGTTQGSPLSPILSNVVLDELDKELESRELAFVRYADDCNIFVRTERSAQRVMKSVCNFIEGRMKLKVNRTKSQVAPSSKVSFLSMTIVDGSIAISRKAILKAAQTVKTLTRTNSQIPLEKSVSQLNEWYKHWFGYFCMTEFPNQLKTLEAHARRRLRARVARRFKRKRHLARFLRQKKVGFKTIKKSIDKSYGPWKLSGTSVQSALKVNWFVKVLGQEILSTRKLSHWKPISRFHV